MCIESRAEQRAFVESCRDPTKTRKVTRPPSGAGKQPQPESTGRPNVGSQETAIEGKSRKLGEKGKRNVEALSRLFVSPKSRSGLRVLSGAQMLCRCRQRGSEGRVVRSRAVARVGWLWGRARSTRGQIDGMCASSEARYPSQGGTLGIVLALSGEVLSATDAPSRPHDSCSIPRTLDSSTLCSLDLQHGLVVPGSDT